MVHHDMDFFGLDFLISTVKICWEKATVRGLRSHSHKQMDEIAAGSALSQP